MQSQTQRRPHTLLLAPNAIHLLFIYSIFIYFCLFSPFLLTACNLFSAISTGVFWGLDNDIWLYVWTGNTRKVSGWRLLNLRRWGYTNAAADGQLRTDSYRQQWRKEATARLRTLEGWGSFAIDWGPVTSVNGYLLPLHHSLFAWLSSLPLFFF